MRREIIMDEVKMQRAREAIQIFIEEKFPGYNIEDIFGGPRRFPMPLPENN